MDKMNNTRRYRYSREKSYGIIEQDTKNKKRLEEHVKKIEIENKKYFSLAIAIINELNKRKINISDSEFDIKLDSIIELILTKSFTMNAHKEIDPKALKNAVKRQIDLKYDKNDER